MKKKSILLVMLSFVLGLMLASTTQADASTVKIYRLYNPTLKEHLYTSDANEKNVLYENAGWGYEGVAWYAPTSGKPVYRLYNAQLKNHLYTTDTNEVNVLTSKYGWTRDNNGKPLFYSGGKVGIYRLYNAGLNGMHMLTTDMNEYKILDASIWSGEGAKLAGAKKGNPISTKYKNPQPEKVYPANTEWRVVTYGTDGKVHGLGYSTGSTKSEVEARISQIGGYNSSNGFRAVAELAPVPKLSPSTSNSSEKWYYSITNASDGSNAGKGYGYPTQAEALAGGNQEVKRYVNDSHLWSPPYRTTSDYRVTAVRYQ
jgi:hypothetical protein